MESESLEQAFHRASRQHPYLANALVNVAVFNGLTLDDLCEILECFHQQLYHLGLCKRPGLEGRDFDQDLEIIAEANKVSIEGLRSLLSG